MANLNRNRKRRYMRHFLREQAARDPGVRYNKHLLKSAMVLYPNKPRAAVAHQTIVPDVPTKDPTVGGFFK